MKKLLGTFVIGLAFISCKKEVTPSPCPGGCNQELLITSAGDTADIDANGYYHIVWGGPNYFTIKGKLSELDPQYILNGVPLIETRFDSDYWVIFDTIQFTSPIYSPLGGYSTNNFTGPIAIGTQTYTLQNMGNEHFYPTNIVGYQLTPNMCYTCSYFPDLIGTYSKYTYKPQQQIFLDNEMIGDTANVFVETIFNNDVGASEMIKTHLKVIFE